MLMVGTHRDAKKITWGTNKNSLLNYVKMMWLYMEKPEVLQSFKLKRNYWRWAIKEILNEPAWLM